MPLGTDRITDYVEIVQTHFHTTAGYVWTLLATDQNVSEVPKSGWCIKERHEESETPYANQCRILTSFPQFMYHLPI